MRTRFANSTCSRWRKAARFLGWSPPPQEQRLRFLSCGGAADLVYRRIAIAYAGFFAAAGLLNYLNGSNVAMTYARILACMAFLTIVLLLLPFHGAKTANLLWLYTINVVTQAVSPVGEWEGAMFALTVIGAMFYEGWFRQRTWLRFAAVSVPVLIATLLSIATTFLVAPAWTEPDLFSSLLGTTLIVAFFAQAGILIVPLVRMARKAGAYEGELAMYRAGMDPTRSRRLDHVAADLRQHSSRLEQELDGLEIEQPRDIRFR